MEKKLKKVAGCSRNKKIAVVVTLFISASTFCCYYHFAGDLSSLHSQFVERNDDTMETADVTITTLVAHPRFAFLLQTEQCLPTHLRQPEYFANNVTCDCHVFVLSYRRQCSEDLSIDLPHVTHVYKNGTTWSTGRNIAYQAARTNNHSYLYYIAMDDDISLHYNEFTPDKYNNTPPLRVFTNFLLEQGPAIAAPEYGDWNKAVDVLHYWNDVCKEPGIPSAVPLYHHDAAFEAFHHSAIKMLLPYEEKYDAVLYYLSALVTTLRITVAFYGQHVYFPYIKAVNRAHRYRQSGKSYIPEHLLCDKKIRVDMVEDVRKRTPSKYHNHPVFEFLLSFPMFMRYYTQCVKPPSPLSPVVAYKQMFNKTQSDVYPLPKGMCMGVIH